MTVTLGNININVELKLVALDSLRYTAKLFRPRHSLEDCVSSASAVAFVVLNSEETSNAERASRVYAEVVGGGCQLLVFGCCVYKPKTSFRERC